MGIGRPGFGILDKAVPIGQSHGLTEDGQTVAPHFGQGDGSDRDDALGRQPRLVAGDLFFEHTDAPELLVTAVEQIFRLQRRE